MPTANLCTHASNLCLFQMNPLAIQETNADGCNALHLLAKTAEGEPGKDEG